MSVALQAKALAPNDPAVASLAGHACFALGRDREAIEYLARALAQDDRQSALWHLRSVSLLRLGRASEAYAHAERACALAPNGADYEWQRRAAGAQAVPDWHFNMVNDEPRNAAFAAAIACVVKADHRVLEIGTGSGLLAMLAARDENGTPRAQRVISCESNPLLARVATEIIRENGLGDRVRVVAKASTELELGRDLSERADLLLCGILSLVKRGTRRNGRRGRDTPSWPSQPAEAKRRSFKWHAFVLLGETSDCHEIEPFVLWPALKTLHVASIGKYAAELNDKRWLARDRLCL